VDCPNCGDTLREGARYCSKCGTRIHRLPATDELTPPPAQAQAPAHPARDTRPPEERLENARVGYQAALNLWNTQVRFAWSRLNAMTVANGVILATIGLASVFSRLFPPFFTEALSLVGIVLCLFWLHSHSHSSQYSRYLLLSACELESHLRDPVSTVSRGALFSEGNEVTLMIDNEKKKLRLGWLPRLAGTDSFSYLVIVTFLVLYIFLLFRA
jgi:hypothetical protein